jgi:hypothetical protein
MGNPVPGDVHVNTPLTNISIAYLQDASNFVAIRVFANIPVPKQADRYYVYERGEFNRDEAEERAPGTESAGGSYTLDNTPTYFARVYAFHKDIPDQVRGNADAVLNPDREATEYVTHKALIKREKIWTTNYFTSGKWTTDIQGVAAAPGAGQVLQWNLDTSTPIENIRDGKRTVLQSTGFEPNTLVIGKAVYDKVVDHPDIIDRVKYGQTPGNPAMANLEALMKLFEVERIFVMKAIENTAAEGVAAVHSFIGGKAALLCYSAPRPGIMTPSAGYTFSWTGFLGAGQEGNRIKRFRMEHLESDRVEVQMAFDLKQVAADLGYFFYDIVA